VNNGLLSVTEAKAMLLSQFSLVESSEVELPEARGRILARSVAAPFDFPYFANSSMDGFAVISSDTQIASQDNPVELMVVGDIPAGTFPANKLETGCCMRIMTGAPLPKGADAVIPLEAIDNSNTQPDSPLQKQIYVKTPALPGEYSRAKGSDFHKGEIILRQGNQLRPQEIGLLAMLGLSRVSVYRRPRIALFSTGSELTPLGEILNPGKIFDANTYSLGALIAQYGGDLFPLGIAKDTVIDVETRLDEAVELMADLIITSAGVSVGAFDYVRDVVKKKGSLLFWRVNMRPGKPLAFGTYRGIPLVGLPGNPVSAFVGFEVFVRPALLKMSGASDIERTRYKVRLQEPITSDGRESYLRGIVWVQDGLFMARLANHQGSGNLFSLVQANALLIVPSEVKSLPIGAEVDAWFFDQSF